MIRAGRPTPSRRGRRATGTDRPPWPFVVLAALATLFFALPFLGLLWRVPWGDVWGLLTEESSLEALRLSLVCSLSATALLVDAGTLDRAAPNGSARALWWCLPE